MNDNDYGSLMQKTLIEYMLADDSVYQRAHSILDPEYFDKEFQPVVKSLMEHSSEYNSLPSVKQLEAETGIVLDIIPTIGERDQEWALDNIEKFCQYGAIVQAVYNAPDYIEKGDRGAVETMVREAVLVGLQKDLGTNYFVNVRERLERLKITTLHPTGWRDMDKKLYGGLNRGEITFFTAGSGVGKSLFLQNLCLNWVSGVSYSYNDTAKEKHYDPLDVVYITLELSEELTSKRLDTMVTGIDPREIFKRIEDVELKVTMKGKNSGKLTVKYMDGANTTCANDIKAYIKEYEIQNGRLPDAIVIDYLDEMGTNGGKIDIANLFIKDGIVTAELRNLAIELDVYMATASQLNRCIQVDERVVIEDKGIIRIGDVKVGDKISSHDGYKTVLEVLPVTTQKIYKIKTKSGKTIKVSGNHKIPTSSGLKTINSGLKIGDSICAQKMK